MPYITHSARLALAAGERQPLTTGELNYVITRVLLKYLGDRPTYACYNAVIGALECAKLELYRRTVVPYEDEKMAENGDVYPAVGGG